MVEGIDLLVISTPEGVQQQGLNLKPVHRQIRRLLGSTVEKNAIWTPVRCGMWV
jgi:hypothetical protein